MMQQEVLLLGLVLFQQLMVSQLLQLLVVDMILLLLLLVKKRDGKEVEAGHWLLQTRIDAQRLQRRIKISGSDGEVELA